MDISNTVDINDFQVSEDCFDNLKKLRKNIDNIKLTEYMNKLNRFRDKFDPNRLIELSDENLLRTVWGTFQDKRESLVKSLMEDFINGEDLKCTENNFITSDILEFNDDSLFFKEKPISYKDAISITRNFIKIAQISLNFNYTSTSDYNSLINFISELDTVNYGFLNNSFLSTYIALLNLNSFTIIETDVFIKSLSYFLELDYFKISDILFMNDCFSYNVYNLLIKRAEITLLEFAFIVESKKENFDKNFSFREESQSFDELASNINPICFDFLREQKNSFSHSDLKKINEFELGVSDFKKNYDPDILLKKYENNDELLVEKIRSRSKDSLATVLRECEFLPRCSIYPNLGHTIRPIENIEDLWEARSSFAFFTDVVDETKQILLLAKQIKDTKIRNLEDYKSIDTQLDKLAFSSDIFFRIYLSYLSSEKFGFIIFYDVVDIFLRFFFEFNVKELHLDNTLEEYTKIGFLNFLLQKANINPFEATIIFQKFIDQFSLEKMEKMTFRDVLEDRYLDQNINFEEIEDYTDSIYYDLGFYRRLFSGDINESIQCHDVGFMYDLIDDPEKDEDESED